jgi:hypothetical protein
LKIVKLNLNESEYAVGVPNDEPSTPSARRSRKSGIWGVRRLGHIPRGQRGRGRTARKGAKVCVVKRRHAGDRRAELGSAEDWPKIWESARAASATHPSKSASSSPCPDPSRCGLRRRAPGGSAALDELVRAPSPIATRCGRGSRSGRRRPPSRRGGAPSKSCSEICCPTARPAAQRPSFFRGALRRTSRSIPVTQERPETRPSPFRRRASVRIECSAPPCASHQAGRGAPIFGRHRRPPGGTSAACRTAGPDHGRKRRDADARALQQMSRKASDLHITAARHGPRTATCPLPFGS